MVLTEKRKIIIPNPINRVTHTHDDPGWLVTVDQYYIEAVEWIFYTMIPILADNPTFKFTVCNKQILLSWSEITTPISLLSM